MSTIETVIPVKETTKKRFNPFSGEKSPNQLKIEAKIAVLELKKEAEGLTPHEARILQANKYKIESKSASKLYKEAEALPEVELNEMLGKAKFPTFAEFIDLLPNKALYSMWDALGVLTKLNKGLTQIAKASKQQKSEDKK